MPQTHHEDNARKILCYLNGIPDNHSKYFMDQIEKHLTLNLEHLLSQEQVCLLKVCISIEKLGTCNNLHIQTTLKRVSA